MLADYAEHSDQISDQDRMKLKAQVANQAQYHASDCRMAATSPREATVPMAQVMNGPSQFMSWGLDVQFNGKRRLLEIDTGASGITISRAAALSLGIKREGSTQIESITMRNMFDYHLTKEVETSIAHVASTKIGGIEFTNCQWRFWRRRGCWRPMG